MAHTTKTKLNHFIERAIPANIRDDHPQFALFIEKYFEYISRDLGEYDLTSNLLDYLNVDKTVSAFYEDFKSIYAPLLPEKYKASLSVIVKNVKHFYQTKGTEDSFKIFFRMIFDTTVNLYYPKVDMLRASDGRWIEPYYLYPTDQTYDNLLYYYDKIIVGSVTNSTAYVKDILQVTDPQDINEKVFVLSLVDRTGVFTNADTITVEGEVTPSTGLDAVDPVIVGDGFWEGTEGWLSWNKYIQDSDYYQDYSYVLESSISADVIEKAIKENVHPAGMKLFALVTAGIQLEDIGVELADFVNHIIDWVRNENVEQTINSISQELASLSVAPKYGSGNDYDWKYFEAHREETAFTQLYPTLATFGLLPINVVSDNYPENYVTITIGGVPSTAFSIINETLTLDTPLASDQFIIVTATDFTIPENSRVYRFSGTTGDDTFILPTKIHRMEIGAILDNPVLTPLSRNIATFDGTNYGVLDTPIVFTGDFEIEVEVAIPDETAGLFQVLTGQATTDDYFTAQSSGDIQVKLANTLMSLTPITDPYDGKVHKWKLSRVGTVGTVEIDGTIQHTATVATTNSIWSMIGGNTSAQNLLHGQILSVKFSDLVTNTVTHSEDLSNWTPQGGTTLISQDLIINDISLDKLTHNGGAVSDGINNDVNVENSNRYYISLYAKQDDTLLSRFGIYNTALPNWEGYLDIAWSGGVPSNGGSSGAGAIVFELIGNGIYRISFYLNTSSSAASQDTKVHIHPDRNGTSKGLWVGGMMLTRGENLNDYFKTTYYPVTIQDNISNYIFDSGSDSYELPEQGVLSGGELISGGTFDTDIINWGNYGSQSTTRSWDAFGGGSLKLTRIAATGYEGASQFNLIVGKPTLVTGRVYRPTGSDAAMRIDVGGNLIDVTPSIDNVWMTFEEVAIPTQTGFALFNAFSSIGAECYFDDISVRQNPAGGSLGSNLFPNGDFDSNMDGVTDSSDAGGSTTWNSGGYLDITNTSGTARFDIAVPTIVGKTYVRNFTNIAGVNIGHIGSTVGNTDIALSSTNTNHVFVAISTTTYFRFYNDIGTSTKSLDNFSVKKLPDLACILTSFSATDWDTYYSRKYLEHTGGKIYSYWLGENLVLNGTFDVNLNSWVVLDDQTSEWSDGRYHIAGDGTTVYGLTQDVGKPNSQHLVSVDYEAVSGATKLQLGSSSIINLNATRTYREVITPSSGILYLYRAPTPGEGYMDNVSVQHLLEIVYR